MNQTAVSSDEDSGRRCGPAQDPPRIGHTAEHEPHHHCRPRADAALQYPERCGQGRDAREHVDPMPRSTPEFRDDDGHDHRHSEGRPAQCEDGQQETGDHRERDNQPRRTRELVIGLSDTLRPEVTRLRGQSPDKDVERPKLSATCSLNGSNQLEILEQNVPVVAAGPFEHIAPNAQSAWPVATGDAIDQHPCGVETGVPGQWSEVILGPDDLSAIESARDSSQGRRVVPHVVVSDDEQRMQGASNTREDASDLSIGERNQIVIDANVFHGVGAPGLEVGVDRRARTVDYEDLHCDVEAGKEAQISEHFVGHGRSQFDRQDVGHRLHVVTGAIRMPPAESADVGAEVAVEPTEQARWIDLARSAAERFGTPCYLNRTRPIQAAVQQLERSDDGVRAWLSYKTHPLPHLLEWWIAGGRGVEVVSESEFTTARRLGCSPDHLLVNGPAKHAWLGRHPIPRLRVHFDSPGELTVLLPLAVSCRWRVGVRIHAPDERDARDPRFGGPFGMTTREAVDALRQLLEAGADVQSVHFHLGQAHQRADACVRAVEHVARICDAAEFLPRYVDLGGGLPAPPAAASAVADLWRGIASARAHFPALEQIWLENGRFVTDQAAALVVRVIDVKDREESRYLICDGGRTNHALAADRGVHPLLLVPERTGPTRLTTICGPTCMTDDTLGRLHLPEDIVPGDVLVWMNAGAYHLPWETRFSQGLCAIVWADENEQLSLVREREYPPGIGAA